MAGLEVCPTVMKDAARVLDLGHGSRCRGKSCKVGTDDLNLFPGN